MSQQGYEPPFASETVWSKGTIRFTLPRIAYRTRNTQTGEPCIIAPFTVKGGAIIYVITGEGLSALKVKERPVICGEAHVVQAQNRGREVTYVHVNLLPDTTKPTHTFIPQTTRAQVQKRENEVFEIKGSEGALEIITAR